MRVIDIENIVTNMKDDTRFVLRCEEVFHDKISSAAASILMNKGQKPIVCLTGPSGSGKTTTAMRLREYLENLGVKVCMLSMDNFFLPLDQRPPEASDWESPYCVNRDLLIEDIHRLMDGELVELPVYDFKAGGVGGYKPMQGDKDAVIIAEGIHMLNPLIFDQLRSEATGVYVAPRTRIITHKDRIVRPEQLRVARRMIRDYQGRGHSLRQTVERAESVDRGKGEEHHRVSLERVADGDRHRRAGDGHGVGADIRQKRNAQLRAERLDDRADQQRAEEALRHCAERIDAVALGRNFNVFAFAERFEFFHDILTA